ncbi:extracellular solute-binding protein [Paenibacillus sp. MMS20-IR301]|uniref:extracellular solute-binding protein n=1 Tax=Paenibacillus sp. MMS20-IR301 TaxID=2895946 RepID=UPI0028E86F5B|nr:extracellular solute-binding protein [Paenibacillus sp. MMS20-IR301]WNS43808.1 extracellular solute-binding protein [Paenibacillus sp. MMS20-IR301]
MLRRKNYWLLFAVLLLSLTSLSPSMELDTDDRGYPPRQPLDQSERPPSGEQGDNQSLSIRVSLSTGEFNVLKRISSNYTLSSGVNVLLTNVDTETGAAQLQEELTVGESPDIVMLDGHSIYDLASRGYLLPVDIYQSVPGSTPLTMLLPQMQWNGYDWGVPLDIDPYVLVYSPQRLAELGLAAAPSSLEEWRELLGRLQAEEAGGSYLLAMDTRNPYGYAAVLQSMGGGLLDTTQEEALWTEAARGFFYLTSRFNGEIWDMLQDGKLAVAAVPLSEWKVHGNSTLAVQAPQEREGARIDETVNSRFLALPAQSGSPEAAVKWLAYVTSSSAQLEWLENTDRLPALDELYRSGLPQITRLPFDYGVFLRDEDTPGSEPGGIWSRSAAAAMLLLTGKVDAAGYEAALAGTSE